LNDSYHRFQYGEDEDFEARAAAMTMADGSLLPDCCIVWELRYFDIWKRYTDALIDCIYTSDQTVVDDKYLKFFHDQLCIVMLNGLPKRYENFTTKAGVARYAADTIHHLVIRHQVYGTTGVRSALDPRIMKSQVPRDGGTVPVDEWRALAFVALATGRARFTLLRGNWTYLIAGVDAKYQDGMRSAFDRLQDDLNQLEAEWTSNDVPENYNYDYFRALPHALHAGPGY